jgi:ABC-type nickel/cobalt efflux system permease component RcnA
MNKRENKIIKTDILYKVIIPCIVVIMLILLIIKTLTLKLNITGVFSAELLQLISTVIIAFVGIYIFLNRNRDEELNYLELNLNVIDENGYLKLRTEVTNPTQFDREIYFACLIVNRTNLSFLDILNKKINTKITDPNSIYELKGHPLKISRDFAFIPLKYFYEENVWVGNEKLIYEVPIKSKDITHDHLNFFDVRFFVFRERKDLKSYHRSVACSFGIKGNLNLDHLNGLTSIIKKS